MKSYFTFAAFALIALAMIVFPDQTLAAVASADSLPFLSDFHAPDGVMLGLVSVAPLANLDGTSYQEPNPGGIRRLYLVLKRDIVGVWPKLADLATGEITVAPMLAANKTFAEYEFAPDTCSLDDDDSGDPGFMSYKHTLGFMIAGISKVKVAEIKKHLNAGCVAVAEMNDGQYVVGGSSDNPINLKKGFKSGAKGSDKRGYTFKGEQDGFMWGITPLAASVVTALALSPDEDED